MDIDSAFPTVERPKYAPGILKKPKNNLSWKLFGLWAWSPIVSFQIGLTASYISLLYFGVSGLFASPPSFDTTVPDWWVGYWAVALIIGAIAAGVGSVSRTKVMELIETAGSFLLTLTVGSYALIVLWLAYGQGDEDRVVAGAGYAALAVPIIVRSMWLMSQLLRK